MQQSSSKGDDTLCSSQQQRGRYPLFIGFIHGQKRSVTFRPRLRYFVALGGFGVPSSAGSSDDIDRSNVEAFPQFKHSAAGLPLAPDSSRNALAPQCGQTNFMIALSGCRGLPAQVGGAVVTTAGSLLARTLCPAALLPPRTRRAARSDCWPSVRLIDELGHRSVPKSR